MQCHHREIPQSHCMGSKISTSSWEFPTNFSWPVDFHGFSWTVDFHGFSWVFMTRVFSPYVVCVCVFSHLHFFLLCDLSFYVVFGFSNGGFRECIFFLLKNVLSDFYWDFVTNSVFIVLGSKERNAEECDNLQCSNNGICSLVGGKARCNCSAGYSGLKCQKDVCLGFCKAGTCVRGHSPRCVCPAGEEWGALWARPQLPVSQ